MSSAAPPEANCSITHFRCKKDFFYKIQCDSFDEATADMINDGAADLLQQFSKIRRNDEKDETKKVMPELMSVSVPLGACQALL